MLLLVIITCAAVAFVPAGNTNWVLLLRANSCSVDGGFVLAVVVAVAVAAVVDVAVALAAVVAIAVVAVATGVVLAVDCVGCCCMLLLC